MPSLNIPFTDEEHAQIVQAAAESGQSLKVYVHDAAIAQSRRKRVAELSGQIAAWSADLNKRLA